MTARAAPVAAMQRMLRSLIEDRCNVVLHEESREPLIYALVIGRSDRKLGAHPTAICDLRARTVSVIRLVSCAYDVAVNPSPRLSHRYGRRGQLHLEQDGYTSRAPHGAQCIVHRQHEGWVPMQLPPPAPNSPPGANAFASLPPIFSVLGKLGLERQWQEDSLPVYTVEHVERPNLP